MAGTESPSVRSDDILESDGMFRSAAGPDVSQYGQWDWLSQHDGRTYIR